MDELIKDRDIVIVGLTPYDVDFGSNCKNIAEELAKYNRVLYINRPLDRFTLFFNAKNSMVGKRRKVLAGTEPNLVQVEESLWCYYPVSISESVNWLNVDFLFDYFNKKNNLRVGEEIRGAVQKLGFKDIILFNDNDIFRSFYLKEMLNPSLYVYYIRDYLIGLPYWAKHGKRLEEQLIRKSDVVVANSTYLSDYAATFNRHSYYVGQGCEISRFNEESVSGTPPEMKGIDKPVIGYVGALDSNRLDINVLICLAEKLPGYQLVLVGMEDERFKQSKLHQMPNVIFTGMKKVEELPDYIACFDVCINPQILNPITIGNYPRKIDEYLAMGKPVVATKTKAMEAFKEHVYLAKDPKEYLQLVQLAIKEHTLEKAEERKAFAGSHTWENSVKEICSAIIKVIGSNKKESLKVH
jgi:teichuronic acid biosynthesis glycosyltransferase TuaH